MWQLLRRGPANGLVVSLKRGANATPITNLLQARGINARIEYADAVDEACTSRNVCDSPRRGGVGITMPTGSACSVGWIVTRNGARGAVTAGHCAWDRKSGSVNSGAFYGSINSINALSAGTHADMRFIDIPGGAQPWLYQHSTTKARTVTGSSLGAVGATACLFFGRNSEFPRCGTISSTNASHFSNTCSCAVYG